jgi:uncharacterized protein YigE (DUF2233 family)
MIKKHIKWFSKLWKIFMIVFATILLLTFAFSARGWQTLDHGIEYLDLKNNYITPWSHIHAFRINLSANKIRLVMAKDLLLKHASANQYADHSKALITINGGFFDKNFKPLGLRITQKKQHNPLKNISWWGVLYIKNNKAFLSSANQFIPSEDIDFAIQSGPRLLINGRIPTLKPGRAERSALGITNDGRLIVVVTDNTPLSTTELAHIMQSSPLNCTNALNLDGGSSSQLHAEINTFRLDVHGFSNVSDAIIVKPILNK